jgi:cysteine-rich repeat protein
VLVSTCERCDDGAANSDGNPDACRTDCTRPRCGDGVTDGGESCDDGNTASCDGCSAMCTVELGLSCGDGVVAPHGCGETCDDGNGVVGDGCSSACALERIPGGGSTATDCYTEWRVDNPANEPLYDKHGAFSQLHTCVDDDPFCDFDGGTPGSCTFHVAVCANNVDDARCETPSRLATWTLDKPSSAQAAKRPALAAVRAALQGTVPGAIVGPTTTDLCSPPADVVLPLRGSPGAWQSAKIALKTKATVYDGSRDIDTLKLICLPRP